LRGQPRNAQERCSRTVCYDKDNYNDNDYLKTGGATADRLKSVMQYPLYTGSMTTRPQDHFIQVQGHTVRYWAQGEAGPTVLLLHGISCSVVEWEHNIAALATQHRVIALDLLGCGLSDKPLDADYDMQSQAKFVFAFMDAMGLSHASMVGNSMGGCIALECVGMLILGVIMPKLGMSGAG
jgi:pimeloyl-ACP methyl ester carboxylesterase